MLIRAMVCVFVTAGCLGGGAVRAAVVFEEDFEAPDTTNYITYSSGEQLVTANNVWSITENSVDLYDAAARPEAAAFDGSQAVDLAGSPGAGAMEATFATVPGAIYRLTFHYSHNIYISLAIAGAAFEVVADGPLPMLEGTVTRDPSQVQIYQYAQYSDTMIAATTYATLRFRSLVDGFAGITIDAISVERVYDLPGDLDGDGFVGIGDLNIILSNWNQTVTPGDLLQGDVNCDGFVGIEDLGIPLTYWNTGTPPTGEINIPEPGSVVFFVGFIACGVRRKLGAGGW